MRKGMASFTEVIIDEGNRLRVLGIAQLARNVEAVTLGFP